ncbi:MAG: M36 family metallopeptidase [Actinomycetota bacterium]
MLALFRDVRRRCVLAVVLVAFIGLNFVSVPASGSSRRNAGGPRWSFQGEDDALQVFDARSGRVAPSAGQQGLVRRLKANVIWNRFGTPRSLIRPKAALATGLTGNAAASARGWIRENRALFRLSRTAVADLELVHNVRMGKGRAVLFRQRFDGVEAARDGMISLALNGGKLLYVSSSATGSVRLTNIARLSPGRAFIQAAKSIGRSVSAANISRVRRVNGWTRLSVKGFSGPQHVRLAALPTPRAGVRLVFEAAVADVFPRAVAFSTLIDAETGAPLLRESNIDYLDSSSPEWKVFPNAPPLDYSSSDTREVWCWLAVTDCVRELDPESPDLEWDVIPPAGTVSDTSIGNNADTVENWSSANPFSVGVKHATPSATREYMYPWTNQWFEERCNPAVFTSPELNDIDAAIANLFAMHNRMHDWSYFLGFTEQTYNLQTHNFGRGGLENDPERGNAQAGGIVGGPPNFLARDNANQITFADGIAPITNMYLWQPIAAAFYSPCVDGDYDMTVIGHEYTHAISNRMIAGPVSGLSGPQAGAMGESWSDLTAVEYLSEYGFTPIADENPFAVGPYVTQDKQAGIRNYGMNFSPLNYSNIGYDLTGPQVHADGEIWSAANYRIRAAMVARYGSANQVACANGQLPPDQCPGNRRWMQLVFDAYLLPAAGTVSMVDMRDAMLTADQLRFDGANQDLLWNAFASRGLGENAFSNTNADPDPVPSFTSPFANESTVTFKPTDLAGNPIVAQLFVGDYQARTVPVADTDPATALPDTFQIVPGTYDFVARGNGFGLKRFVFSFKAGQVRDLPVSMPPNLASSFRGATTTGDGVNRDKLIDDTEATNWASLGSPVAGKKVTVRLDPSAASHQIARVQVSAMLRPRNTADPNDSGTQSRFSALRAFEIWTCEAKETIDCSQDSQFTKIFTSPADAFPSVAPRPRAPELIVRSFVVPKVKATFVRLVVVTNQCTGAPAYQGDQDDDPLNTTDCSAGSTQDDNVRAAELQVFQK